MDSYRPPDSALAAGQGDLGRLFSSTARAHPEHIALVDGDSRLTYRQLDVRTSRLANRFIDTGLKPGDRVALLAPNCAEYFEIELAAAKAGIIVAALNWRLGPRELQHCIALVSPSLIIVSEALRANLDRIELPDAPIVTLGDEYEMELDAGASEAPDLRIDTESGLIILYTSGTTGLPKGALISHRAMVARGAVYTSELEIPRFDPFIAWAPCFHMVSTDHGLAHLLRGGTVYCIDGYQPEPIIDLIEEHTMAWLVLVPGMIAPFVEAMKARDAKPRGIGCAGAMADLIPREELAAVTIALNAPFLNTFGATETGLAPASGSVIGIGEMPDRLPKRQCAFVDVRLVDPEDNEVPVGTPGEVALSGPTLFSGYWNNDEVNRHDFRGGRFHMGDVMRRNPDGTLEYVDRVKYMIKSGGENIYPAEIEQVVATDSRVETAVVVRKPDPRWGEIPVLFVVARDESLDEDALLALCAAELSSYKRPREIHFLTDADLPRSTSGKIQRHLLEERLNT
jgi:acyl-CoA synthetase (AMP-forming)/AMP-acid ligase II